MHYNTEPHEYVLPIAGQFHPNDYRRMSPSERIFRVLQKVDARVTRNKFRASVLDAIFDDGVTSFFNDDEEHAKKVCRRLARRVGKARARRLLIERCDILDTWRHRDARFRPDAYIIDAPKRTVVCYEIEDTHPLNPLAIEAYSAAWWNLEFIFWDLHLISYDIYGHHRVHHLGETSLVAREIERDRRGGD
jgi:hypothetical protein